jgi:hypothetical protein
VGLCGVAAMGEVVRGGGDGWGCAGWRRWVRLCGVAAGGSTRARGGNTSELSGAKGGRWVRVGGPADKRQRIVGAAAFDLHK